jgi:hypothetical protein
MKKIAAVAVVLLVAVALYFFFHPKKTESAFTAPVLLNSSDAASAPASRTSSDIGSNESARDRSQASGPASQAGELITDSSPPVDLPPETVLQNIGRAVHQFGEMFGGNPVGGNSEITSQLSGDNPKHINFLSPQPGAHIDGKGELVDVWGTPYFFHQISGSEMEIHSAGPDKTMWTADDLVVK